MSKETLKPISIKVPEWLEEAIKNTAESENRDKSKQIRHDLEGIYHKPKSQYG